MNYLTTFFSVSDALKLEKVLRERGIEAKMTQVPRALGASCGYVVESKLDDIKKLTELAERNKIDFDKNYEIIFRNRLREYKIVK